MASLHLLDGSGVIDLTIPGIYTLGRDSSCDFVLTHPSVSGTHALLDYREDGLFIQDQNSTNGVRVNYADVTRHCLLDGDVLEIGSVSYNVIGAELREHAGKEAPAAAAPQADHDGHPTTAEPKAGTEKMKRSIATPGSWTSTAVTLGLLLLAGLLLILRIQHSSGTP